MTDNLVCLKGHPLETAQSTCWECFEECFECGGGGYDVCFNCGGSGEVEVFDEEDDPFCDECFGSGSCHCFECDGTGVVPRD